MTGRVELDPDVMDAVRRDLQALADAVPGLQARASGLQAGHLLTGLSTSGEWSRLAAADLQDRLDLLAHADQLDSSALAALGFSVQDVAGARSPVLDSLLAVDSMVELQQQTPGPVDWSRRPLESIDDYVQRMVERGLTGVLGDGPVAAVAGDAYDVYGTYNGLLAAGAGSVAAVRQFNLAYRGRPWINTVSGGLGLARGSVVASYLEGLAARAAMTSPFTANGMVQGQAVRGLLALRDPVVLADRLADVQAFLTARGHPGLAARVPGAAPLITRVTAATPFWFGRAWTAPSGVTVARGTANLVTVARSGGLATAARTAGFWRGAGVAGGVVATGYDVANLVAQGNPAEAFEREGAGYVADIARTGFNASLTAAMIAPNPVTWGAVAVTGLVWAGAEIVDNWPAISSAVGEASDRVVDWGSDRLDDAADLAGDVADGFGDAASAVADSKANPMNWF